MKILPEDRTRQETKSCRKNKRGRQKIEEEKCERNNETTVFIVPS